MENSAGDASRPDNRTGSDPAIVTDIARSIDIAENVVDWSLHSVNRAGLMLVVRSGAPLKDSSAGTFSTSRTSASEFAYGSGCKRIESTMLKIAVFAPMARPSVRI